jgi:hypothetical protein
VDYRVKTITLKQFESEYDEANKFIYEAEKRLIETQKYIQYLKNKRDYLIKIAEGNEKFQETIKACDKSIEYVKHRDKENKYDK